MKNSLWQHEDVVNYGDIFFSKEKYFRTLANDIRNANFLNNWDNSQENIFTPIPQTSSSLLS